MALVEPFQRCCLCRRFPEIARLVLRVLAQIYNQLLLNRILKNFTLFSRIQNHFIK